VRERGETDREKHTETDRQKGQTQRETHKRDSQTETYRETRHRLLINVAIISLLKIH